jgi:putative flavoprotein involved in K+ transport
VTLVIRRAREADQSHITTMVRAARINPRGLQWPRFVVAEDEGRIVGVAQIRHHPDGAHELASLVVDPQRRGERIASRMIENLLSDDHGRLYMVVDRPFAKQYERWGFQPVGRKELPRSLSREYRIGRIVTTIGSAIVRRRIRIVPLERAASASNSTQRYPVTVPYMTDPVVIIGAGPAGLAVAATLRQLAVPFVVLERSDSVGAAWHGRYDSLHLHTIRWLSGLPGVSIPRRFGRWVARDDLIEYLEAYADRFGVRPEFAVDATRIDRGTSVWHVHTTSGTWFSSAVVVATGYTRRPYLPDWPGRNSFTGTLVHSADYREPSPYLGQQVLVVGAGNSAAEIALELTDVCPQVDLSVRTPPNIVRRDTLGIPSQLIGIALKRAPERLMNPMSALLRRFTVPDLADFGLPAPPGDGFTQFLRTSTVPILDHGFVSAVRSRRIQVVPPIERFDGAAVHLHGGTTVRPDAIVSATGYRPDLDALVGPLGVLDDHGMPRARGAQTVKHAPGLHFVGIDVTLSGLLRDIGLEARGVGRALSAQRVHA